MTRSLALRINRTFFYGWIILFVSAVSYFFSSPGQTYSISVFIDSYIADFGYSRTLISSIYSFATVLSGLTMIFVGRAVDRFGARHMLLIAGSLLALTCVFNSFIFTIPMIFISFFLLRFCGQGSLTLIPGSLVPQWFSKKRALALSLLTLGTMLGNLVIPYFNHTLIEHIGWNKTWLVWAGALVILYLPLAWFFVINKPEDIGLLPDNEAVQDEAHLSANLEKLEKESFHLSEASKTKEFWFIGIISMILPLITTGMMFHFYSIMRTKGIDDNATSIIMGLIALPGFIMPIIAGTIMERVQPKRILFVSLMLVTVDLLFINMVHTVPASIAFILIYGISNSIVMVITNVIWANYFGRLHLGSIRGAATVFIVIGSALGTIPFGLSYDLTGDYFIVFIFMAVLTLLSAILSGFIKKPHKQN